MPTADGVAVICRAGAPGSCPGHWGPQTPCQEWRAAELAGHLRCVADDFHEYLDEAPVSRYARLMATGRPPGTLGRKLARQNAAELAALADAPAAEHIAAFAQSARAYAARLQPRSGTCRITSTARRSSPWAGWRARPAPSGTCTPGTWPGRSAPTTGPADPAAVLAGWRAGMPHLPAGWPAGGQGRAPRRPRGRLCSRPRASPRHRPPRTWPMAGARPGCAASA